MANLWGQFLEGMMKTNAFRCFPMTCSEVSCPLREVSGKAHAQFRQQFCGSGWGGEGTQPYHAVMILNHSCLVPDSNWQPTEMKRGLSHYSCLECSIRLKMGFLGESKGTATKRCTKQGKRHEKQVAGDRRHQQGVEADACGRGTWDLEGKRNSMRLLSPARFNHGVSIAHRRQGMYSDYIEITP